MSHDERPSARTSTVSISNFKMIAGTPCTFVVRMRDKTGWLTESNPEDSVVVKIETQDTAVVSWNTAGFSSTHGCHVTMPNDPGLYHVHFTIDGMELIGSPSEVTTYPN
jgi:hypothetical protein